MSIHVERRRDVIERPIVDLLDINGWDLRKALQLMLKSNPPLFEWLHSPIVYREQPGFHQAILALTPTYYSPRDCAWHYLHMARGNQREYLRGDPVKLKKYLYVLRPLLAIRWLESGRGVVPMPFRGLVETLLPAGEVREAIEQLLLAKQSGGELAWGPRVPALSDWINAELARLESGPQVESSSKRDSTLLDSVFRDWLEC